MSQDMPTATNDGNTRTGYRQTTLIIELRAGMGICVYGDEHLKIGYFSGVILLRGSC